MIESEVAERSAADMAAKAASKSASWRLHLPVYGTSRLDRYHCSNSVATMQHLNEKLGVSPEYQSVRYCIEPRNH